MRIDKNSPHQVYDSFAEWLQWHPVWFLNVVFAYAYYLVSTEEI